jgi:hypothetical protein
VAGFAAQEHDEVIRLCRGPGYADLLADALVSELITAAGSA